ncbi:MAG: hypothetical protein ACFFHD_14855 [Promethearchaeota archaeon]
MIRNEVKLFGFRLNNNSAVILFYLSLIATIQSVGTICSFILDLFFYEMIDLIILIITYLIILLLNIYILIICTRIKRSYKGDDAVSEKWFGFRLMESSLLVIFILSLLALILVPTSLYFHVKSVITLIIFSRFDLYYLIRYTMSYIFLLILIAIHIYTILKCVKIKKFIR